MQPLHDLGRAARHRLDRGAAIARSGQGIHVRARGGCDLLAADVRLGQGRPDDPGVHEHDLDAVLPHAVAEELVLPPFRVERAEENDRRQGSGRSGCEEGRVLGAGRLGLIVGEPAQIGDDRAVERRRIRPVDLDQVAAGVAQVHLDLAAR